MTDSNFPPPPPSLAERVSSFEDRVQELEGMVTILAKEVVRESRGGSPPESTVGPP